MKRARTGKRPGGGKVRPRTGSVSAIDRALMKHSSNPSVGGKDHTYRIIELVGSSEVSISDAIDSAIARAHRTLRHLRWFEVVRTSGHIEDGKVLHYQVTLKVGFTMEEPGR